jgi:hypothetical protein
MIANHPLFLESIQEMKRVRVRFFSLADGGVLDRVCAPLDYGPGNEPGDGLHRYWLWDYQQSGNSHFVGLLPQQILDLKAVGEEFDPSEFGAPVWSWALPRSWSQATKV